MKININIFICDKLIHHPIIPETSNFVIVTKLRISIGSLFYLQLFGVHFHQNNLNKRIHRQHTSNIFLIYSIPPFAILPLKYVLPFDLSPYILNKHIPRVFHYLGPYYTPYIEISFYLRSRLYHIYHYHVRIFLSIYTFYHLFLYHLILNHQFY